MAEVGAESPRLPVSFRTSAPCLYQDPSVILGTFEKFVHAVLWLRLLAQCGVTLRRRLAPVSLFSSEDEGKAVPWQQPWPPALFDEQRGLFG